MKKGTGEYAVGYMKPPAANRFKPGQSGNPRGRTKGRKNFRTEIAEILEAPVTITEGGEQKRVTSRAATLMRLREKALKGDTKAMDRLLQLAAQHAADEEAAGRERAITLEEDDILTRYVEAQWEASSRSENSTNPTPGCEDERSGGDARIGAEK